jgi:hypothetical protein
VGEVVVVVVDVAVVVLSFSVTKEVRENYREGRIADNT